MIVASVLVVATGEAGTATAQSTSTSSPATSQTSETSSTAPSSTRTESSAPSSSTTSSSSAASSSGDVSCPAVHMLLAPGTSETARWAEPNKDTHGFLSRNVARPALGSINEQTVRDLSGGFAQLLNLPEGMAGPLGDAAVEATSRDSAAEQGGAPKLTRTYVTYPATVGGAQPPGQTELPENAGDLTSYEDSLNTGIDMTEDLIADISSRCPDTKVFLTGFSQGSEVIDNVARRIGAGEADVDPDTIAGVSLFANPPREGGTPLQPTGAATVGAVPGTSGEHVKAALTGLDRMATANAGGLSTDKTGIDGYGALADRTISWCLTGDYVCGLPIESDLIIDIVKELEPMSLGDPVDALERLARILDRAVSVGDLSEIADIEFAGTGFDTRPDGGAETPVLNKRVEAATTADESGNAAFTEAPSQREAGNETSTSTTQQPEQDSPTSQTDNGAEAESGANEREGAAAPAAPEGEAVPAPAAPAPGVPGLPAMPALPGLPAMPALPELPPPPPLPTPEQAMGTVVGVAAGLGGMALGAGITVARKTLTPENLAQIAVAGVGGGPQAAAAVAGAKLSGSAMSLLEPGTATGYARQTLHILQDNGIPVPEQAEMAVSLASWLSTNEHNAYADRPVLPDGRSPAAATTDWVEAITADLSEADSSTSTTESTTTAREDGQSGLPEADAERGIDALDRVDFDSDKATKALAAVDSSSTTTSAPTSASESSPASQTTTSGRDHTATSSSTPPSTLPSTEQAETTSIEGK